MNDYPQKDNRRGDKFNRSKKHFSGTKHKPRTKSDQTNPRKRPAEDQGRTKIGGRKEGRRVAGETLKVIENGYYKYCNEDNQQITVDISIMLDNAIKNTITYQPDETPIDIEQFPKRFEETEIELVKNTTLEACYDEYTEQKEDNMKIAALNFASAKKPGGGFINGAKAQEESIARASGLYECINDSNMYEVNNEDNNFCLYSHHMIISEDVPIFRNDDNEFLPNAYPITILTVPAVNSGEALKLGINEEIIEKTMISRMDRMFSVAVKHQLDTIVLGSWGCGVFGGDLDMVSRNFLNMIFNKYYGYFNKIIFAVLSDKDYSIFEGQIDYQISKIN